MKDRYFEIYKLTNSIAGIFVRFFLFVLVFIYAYMRFSSGSDLKPVIAIFAAVLINELFLEHIKKIEPEAKVNKREDKFEDSLVFSAKKALFESKNSYEFVKKIKNSQRVKFFRNKLGLLELADTKITKEELLKQAFEAVVWVEGLYITDVDLFAAYVLLSEDTTNFLQKNNLNNDDVINILYWTRREFFPDNFIHDRIVLTSPGVFDSLVYGWNYELKKYSLDLSLEVLSRRFPPRINSAEKEFHELEVALSRHKSSSAIIVGEPGTGKSTLVEYLAYSSFFGKTSQELSHRKVFELLVDKIISGISTPGDLEGRLSEMLAEIIHSGNSIIFIQNIENIFGGGGFNLDISGVLDEYLKSDKIKIVGTTTPGGFADFIAPKVNTANLFEKIEVPETNPGKTLLLLTTKAQEVESKYKIKINYSALKQVVILSELYFPDRFLPGRAIDLLEDVASKAQIEKNKEIDAKAVIEFVQSKTKVVLEEPDTNEKDLLIHLEEKLHQRVIGQDEAIVSVAGAMRRLRSGFKDENRPISVFLFLGPTGVGKTETAKALAAEYFHDEKSMIRFDMSELQTQGQLARILGSAPGQEHMPNSLVEQVENNPFSLVLLDEFEKADPKVLNIFLQVFDEGRLTDNSGKTVSFKNTIIIATSNAGSEMLREKEKANQPVTKEDIVDYVLTTNKFTPELVNRFDDVVLFKFLDNDEVKKISNLLLTQIVKKLSDNQINITFDDKVLSKIATEAYNSEFGARNVRRYIDDNIEDFLSKAILEGEIQKGANVTLSVDEKGSFVIT